tara:strand:- start:456 stop:974 length:519 start_codon:yes stop_codon:yes gene_type:complete
MKLINKNLLKVNNKQMALCFGIFLSLAATRFIPHPPNFTSLIALSFYVPVFLGLRFIPIVIISFAVTDLVIGYHSGTHWTWGSVLLIGLSSQFFTKNTLIRLTGVICGALIFFIITNFGVWSSGMYGYTLQGLYTCFILAIPFFGYSIVSTLIFSSLIEIFYKLYQTKLVKQ